ncbi:MAG: OmpH family outer membrane protein [Planctomycetota bacterium]
MRLRIVSGMVFAMAGALVGWGALSLRAAAQVERQALKVGVVDFKRAFDSYKKKAEHEAKIEAENNRISEEVRAKNEELKTLQTNVQLFEEGSEERNKADEALRKKRIEYQAFVEQSKQDLMRMQRNSIVAIYDDITKVIREYGKAQEFDLIIKRDVPDLRASNLLDLQFQINNHKLLYNSDALDVTDAIVARLQATAP